MAERNVSLEVRIKNVLAEASLIAEASAAGLNEPTSHGKAGSKEPTTGGTSTYDQIQRRLSRAGNAQERLRAVEWGEGLVRAAKRQKPVELSPKQRDYWVLVSSQGRDYRDVAAEFGLKETTVWKMRSENGYEPRKGFPKAA